jgi:hypothetical protein
MRLKIRSGITEDVGKRIEQDGFPEQAYSFLNSYSYGKDDSVILKIKGDINPQFVAYLRDLGKELGLRGVQTQCTQVLAVINSPAKAPIKSLRSFEAGLLPYLEEDAIDGWMYHIDHDDNRSAYIVSRVEHKPADPRTESPETVSIYLLANSPRNDSSRATKTLSFTIESVKKKTIPEALAAYDMFKENAEDRAFYDESIRDYRAYQPKYGEQFLSSGFGLDAGRSNWRSDRMKFAPAGVPSKLVNDDDQKVRSYANYSDSSFWGHTDSKEALFGEMPFHPYLLMFDLQEHKQFWVHASVMSPYIYDPSLRDKLVLPQEHRDLIDILTDDMDVVMDDIVAGKSGGSTILCMGGAGLGKTLSAEVYSEVTERPLYRVHSGQLGTTPDTVEGNLKKILDRSARWGSVLLIDEADVYIRERDNSMNHNAIVAAFLRTLEYFSGLLFMTTNRSGDVDDAIKSRCIAIIKYETPGKLDARRIWSTLSAQFKIEMEDGLVEDLVDKYPNASGRDIKELLKLASKYSRQRNVDIDLELFRKCSMFRGIDMGKT